MDDIIKELVKFRDERDWSKFHTPENLSKSIMIEAAELLENFQWGSGWDNKVNVKEEIADVLAYTLLLCHELKLDPKEIVREKMIKNTKKYENGDEKINGNK